MRTPPRRADEHLKWLRSIASPEDSYRPEGPLLSPPLGALTGTDHRALEAIDRLWDAHSYCDHPDRIITAIALVALEMQASTRAFARELIAKNKDWNDRARLWPLVEREMARHQTLNERAREPRSVFDAEHMDDQQAHGGGFGGAD